MTMATLSHVHTSPRKPCASAPRCRSSGTLARCSSLKRGRAPGAGRRLRASTPPPSRARFIHWLTAPLLTPRASAMRCWDHPSCLSSKALRRLPSRQSVAPLESELSISGSYHQRLAISAEVSRRGPLGEAHALVGPLGRDEDGLVGADLLPGVRSHRGRRGATRRQGALRRGVLRAVLRRLAGERQLLGGGRAPRLRPVNRQLYRAPYQALTLSQSSETTSALSA